MRSKGYPTSPLVRSDEKIHSASNTDSGFDKEDERVLKKLSFYHGFLPREDLIFLLHYVGEFLLRLSEVDHDPQHPVKKEIILSVVCEGEPDKRKDTPAMIKYEQQEEERNGIKKYARVRGKVTNIIIHRQSGKYMLESTHAFNSLCDLINYYRKKPCLFFGAEFILQHPIPPQSWEYHHSDICPGKILGEGAYGMVRAGTLRQKNGKAVKVAIKQSKCHSEMRKAKIKEMMNEARLMRLLKHKNIVHLYGVAVTEQPILIVLELVNGGALNSFLRKHGVNLNVKEKISLCAGAGSGVEYLHQNDCIHRDLAARNCLITEDKVVKISDFGLSRMGTQYTLKAPMKLPIRWLAPESLETFTFSQKSDVFSFGVLAYEIFSNGGEPWDGMTNAEVRVAVASGKFLVFPNTCPERLRNFFALRVFAKESPERATMSEIMKTLKMFLT